MICRVLFVLAGVLAASPTTAASRASCADMIATLGAYLEAHPETSGTRRQTKEAQLMHQPTRDSVAKAKRESRENLVTLLAKAKAEQSAGDEAGCRTTLVDVQRMLKP